MQNLRIGVPPALRMLRCLVQPMPAWLPWRCKCSTTWEPWQLWSYGPAVENSEICGNRWQQTYTYVYICFYHYLIVHYIYIYICLLCNNVVYIYISIHVNNHTHKWYYFAYVVYVKLPNVSASYPQCFFFFSDGRWQTMDWSCLRKGLELMEGKLCQMSKGIHSVSGCVVNFAKLSLAEESHLRLWWNTPCFAISNRAHAQMSTIQSHMHVYSHRYLPTNMHNIMVLRACRYLCLFAQGLFSLWI